MIIKICQLKNGLIKQKRVLVDRVKNTKLVEPITCDKYKIDNVQACSFVYAANDKSGRKTGNLLVLVNDNSSMIHSIKYRGDAAVYDLEEPVLLHLLNSYKLLKNNPASILSTNESMPS